MTRSGASRLHASRSRTATVAILVTLDILIVAGGFGAATSEAAGPWRAQVVDAETGTPLPDVAVLAAWENWPGLFPLNEVRCPGHHSAVETSTDARGRLQIPWRLLVPVRLEMRVWGPELYLFRAGYGGWRFQRGQERLTGPGAVIEMRPLRNYNERFQYLKGEIPGWIPELQRGPKPWRQVNGPDAIGWVPRDQAPRYLAAINAERETVRLEPLDEGPRRVARKYNPLPPPGSDPTSPASCP